MPSAETGNPRGLVNMVLYARASRTLVNALDDALYLFVRSLSQAAGSRLREVAIRVEVTDGSSAGLACCGQDEIAPGTSR